MVRLIHSTADHTQITPCDEWRVRVNIDFIDNTQTHTMMVFNATFNNISVISWRSFFIGGENHRPVGSY